MLRVSNVREARRRAARQSFARRHLFQGREIRLLPPKPTYPIAMSADALRRVAIRAGFVPLPSNSRGENCGGSLVERER